MNPIQAIACVIGALGLVATYFLGPMVLLVLYVANFASAITEVFYTPADALNFKLLQGILLLAILPGAHAVLHLPVYVLYVYWLLTGGTD